MKYNINAFQTLNSFYPKSNGLKKHTNVLTDLNNDFKNMGLINNNKPLYNGVIYSNKNKKVFSQNKVNSSKQFLISENTNILNIPNLGLNSDGKNLYSKNNINSSGEVIFNESDYFTPRNNKFAKNNKLPQPLCLKYKFSDQNEVNYNSNITNYNAYKSQFFSNKKGLNNILNNSANDITNNCLTSMNNSAIVGNYYEDEPQNNFKLTDFTILNEIGKGAEGRIYVIRWKKNNKKYAMKKCKIM